MHWQWRKMTVTWTNLGNQHFYAIIFQSYKGKYMKNDNWIIQLQSINLPTNCAFKLQSKYFMFSVLSILTQWRPWTRQVKYWWSIQTPCIFHSVYFITSRPRGLQGEACFCQWSAQLHSNWSTVKHGWNEGCPKLNLLLINLRSGVQGANWSS